MADEATPPSALPFSDDELYLLTSLPGLVGSAVTFSDVSGPVGTIKEMMANARTNVAGIASREDMRGHALEQAAKVNALLIEKAEPNEATEYREWVMSIAQATAEAAKEGGFLGIGGVRVSVDEQQALDEIAAALGTSPSDG